ncbi:hypothetical protein KSS87_014858 [Heliosperma pusillum]|nr:hypothetical protein KSS87_021408 [Heliosperma pusillum]KAH9615874.1 hypothetical protein KSS87_014858 [Heliosperma pusillum]
MQILWIPSTVISVLTIGEYFEEGPNFDANCNAYMGSSSSTVCYFTGVRWGLLSKRRNKGCIKDAGSRIKVINY